MDIAYNKVVHLDKFQINHFFFSECLRFIKCFRVIWHFCLCLISYRYSNVSGNVYEADIYREPSLIGSVFFSGFIRNSLF